MTPTISKTYSDVVITDNTAHGSVYITLNDDEFEMEFVAKIEIDADYNEKWDYNGNTRYSYYSRYISSVRLTKLETTDFDGEITDEERELIVELIEDWIASQEV